MKEILLIIVSGEDKPGVTSAVASVLAEYEVNVLDIGQSVIHNNLSLGVLAQVPAHRESSPVLKDVLFKLHDLQMQVRFEPVSEASYAEWVAQQGKPQHIVTLLARYISAEQIARITQVSAEQGLNIDSILRLSGRVELDRVDEKSKACVEFSIRGEGCDIAEYRKSLLELSGQLNVDIAYQEDSVFRRHRRLVVFDMDSTLIEAEVIDELAIEAGVGEAVSSITARAMAGEIDFQTSFKERVALLKGLEASVLDTVQARLQLTEGAEYLMSTLKSLGYKTAILSGGFTYFAEGIRQRLGIDYMFANELDIQDGVVSGEVSGQIVDGPRKAELLRQLAKEEGICLEQTVAVGDGANDLPMLGIAGLGIAFRAKPVVRANAKQAISNIGLDGVLYLMGIRDREAMLGSH
ncbi:MAG: phosphoserine phosphatase SerB [Gammaproteobacteria bacterium]|nr:phosphoserine phosphatase SerB [Gammaproteobacteria bacterium]MBQ0839935.1 phosphoserine phosphatase SerB [Gammaproteobacteria bacterium]